MSTPEQLAARAAYMKKWRQENLEACRAKEKVRRDKKREEIRAYSRAWYEKNAERVRAKGKRRRKADPWMARMQQKAGAANRNYPGHVTAKDVDSVFKKYGRICHHCGKKNLRGLDLTLEHLKPINDVRYLRPCCHACNVARIPRRGPRKSKEQKKQEARDRTKKWRQEHLEWCNMQWWRMTPAQREERREYMMKYMRKRRAAAKKRGKGKA